MFDKQLARLIYHKAMTTMKFTLELEEQKYETHGRQDPRYKFFKKMIMAETYKNLRELFKQMEDIGALSKTDYEEDVKDGYKDTESGGSGYLNSPKLHKIMK